MFDAIYLGLKAQGFQRSMLPEDSVRSSGNGCAYRGADGRKCAFGHLIPDDRYDACFEGSSAEDVANEIGIFDDIESEEELEKIVLAAEHIQGIHDNPCMPELMQSRLEHYAANHSLTIPS